MNFFPTAVRERFSRWASLAAGLVGTGALPPSPIRDASTLDEPDLGLGLVALARSKR